MVFINGESMWMKAKLEMRADLSWKLFFGVFFDI